MAAAEVTVAAAEVVVGMGVGIGWVVVLMVVRVGRDGGRVVAALFLTYMEKRFMVLKSVKSFPPK